MFGTKDYGGVLLSTNTKLILGVARKHGPGNTEIESNLETSEGRGVKGEEAIIFMIFLPGRKQQAITFHTGRPGEQTLPDAPV